MKSPQLTCYSPHYSLLFPAVNLLFPWYWRRPSSGHSCSDSSITFPTWKCPCQSLPFSNPPLNLKIRSPCSAGGLLPSSPQLKLGGVKWQVQPGNINVSSFILSSYVLSLCLSSYILGSYIWAHILSSYIWANVLSSYILRSYIWAQLYFGFQTSCLIKSATVVFSFPFWANSGQ